MMDDKTPERLDWKEQMFAESMRRATEITREAMTLNAAARKSPSTGGLLTGAATMEYNPRATGDARYAGLDCGSAAGALVWVTGAGSAGGAGSGSKTPEHIARRSEYEAQATAAERSRILALLHDLKPRIRPSHGDWARAWRDEGAKAMYEKIIAAISQPAKAQGEA